ncbi:MAG: hypothetical protein PVJ83_07740 [Gammaproteobacteria bacterium]|jgi:hypothetical protein
MSTTSIERKETSTDGQQKADVLRTRIGTMTYLAPRQAQGSNAPVVKLDSAVENCLQTRELHVVLDLVNVASLDSAALEAIIDAQDTLVRAGGWLKVANLNATNRYHGILRADLDHRRPRSGLVGYHRPVSRNAQDAPGRSVARQGPHIAGPAGGGGPPA